MSPITIHSTQERAMGRDYRDERGFRRVHELLLETYPITPPDFNWEVRRWDRSRPSWLQRAKALLPEPTLRLTHQRLHPPGSVMLDGQPGSPSGNGTPMPTS
jgi:hypothetical protein